jgi:hypothetical protein
MEYTAAPARLCSTAMGTHKPKRTHSEGSNAAEIKFQHPGLLYNRAAGPASHTHDLAKSVTGHRYGCSHAGHQGGKPRAAHGGA